MDHSEFPVARREQVSRALRGLMLHNKNLPMRSVEESLDHEFGHTLQKAKFVVFPSKRRFA